MTADRRTIFFSTALAIVWILLALVLLVVAYPMIATSIRAIADAGTGIRELIAALASGALLRVLANTAIVIIAGTAFALVAGGLMAWVSERTNGSLGAAGELLPLVPLLVPPVAGVIGWAVLLDPRAGLLNIGLRKLVAPLGIEVTSGPLNIYSFGGLAVITGLYLVPYVYLVVAAALRRLDPALEEAARINGSSTLRMLRRVTIPSIRPALVAGGLLALIAGIGLFSVPIVLGTAARVDVISVYIYRLFESYPPQTAYALMLSAILVIVVQSLLVAQRFAAPEGRAATIGGRGVRGARVDLGQWRHLARSLVLLYLAATAILPVAGLILVSLQSFWTPDIRWERLSLANYSFVLLENAQTSKALLTSLGLSALTATVTIAVAALVMLQLHEMRGSTSRIADAIMNLPATLPHTVIGACFLVAFSQAPLVLYGTIWILLLAYIAMALPFAARTASAAAGGIGHELSEASRVCGATMSRTFRRVLLPLAIPGLIAGWIIVFIQTVGEVTASSLLGGARNPVIGQVIAELWVFGSFPQVAALALVTTIVTASFVMVMLLVSRRSSDASL